MFEYPLIRFDDKKRLEELQKGKLFMRNALYYQYLESKDKARSDKYDGSIPVNRFRLNVNGKCLDNIRLTNPKIFIKGFTQCEESDFVKGNDNYLLLSFPPKTKEAIKEFNTDSALIIFSPSRFVEQISNAAKSVGKRAVCQSVEYLTDDELKLVEDSIYATRNTDRLVTLIKHEAFKHQKEFRVCINHRIDGVDYSVPVQDFSKEFYNSPYTLDLGEPVDSLIVPVDTILTDGIMLDTNAECITSERIMFDYAGND